MQLTPKQHQIATGYGAGLTATVLNNKICGESMDLTWEQIGRLVILLQISTLLPLLVKPLEKPLPKDKTRAS